MEAGNSSMARIKFKPCIQLPTVCVSESDLSDPSVGSTAPNQLVLSPSYPSLILPARDQQQPPTTQTSKIFVDTTTKSHQQHFPIENRTEMNSWRLTSGSNAKASSSISLLHEHWLGCRHERNSSSSSDSGVVYQLSPPGQASSAGLSHSSPSAASALSISPPGLSPLQIGADSAFSTPTPSSSSNSRFRTRFTFDPLPSSLPTAVATSANTIGQNPPLTPFFCDLPPASTATGVASTSSLADVLKRIRPSCLSSVLATSGPSVNLNVNPKEDNDNSNIDLRHRIPAAQMIPNSQKTSVFRSESLPAVRCSTTTADMEKIIAYNMNLLHQTRQLSALVSPQKPVSRTASMQITPSQNLISSAAFTTLSASSLGAIVNESNAIYGNFGTGNSDGFTKNITSAINIAATTAAPFSSIDFDQEITAIRAAVELANATAHEKYQRQNYGSGSMSLLTPLHSANLVTPTAFNFDTTSMLLPSLSSLIDLNSPSLSSFGQQVSPSVPNSTSFRFSTTVSELIDSTNSGSATTKNLPQTIMLKTAPIKMLSNSTPNINKSPNQSLNDHDSNEMVELKQFSAFNVYGSPKKEKLPQRAQSGTNFEISPLVSPKVFNDFLVPNEGKTEVEPNNSLSTTSIPMENERKKKIPSKFNFKVKALNEGDTSEVTEGEKNIVDKEGDDLNRQFVCKFCKKDFRRPDILSRHFRRHTGEKPFRCDVCLRYFSRSDHLRTHKRTHTNEKPYICQVCPYAARRRDVLTRHVATRHKMKAPRTIFPRQRRSTQKFENLNEISKSALTFPEMELMKESFKKFEASFPNSKHDELLNLTNSRCFKVNKQNSDAEFKDTIESISANMSCVVPTSLITTLNSEFNKAIGVGTSNISSASSDLDTKVLRLIKSEDEDFVDVES